MSLERIKFGANVVDAEEFQQYEQTNKSDFERVNKEIEELKARERADNSAIMNVAATAAAAKAEADQSLAEVAKRHGVFDGCIIS